MLAVAYCNFTLYCVGLLEVVENILDNIIDIFCPHRLSCDHELKGKTVLITGCTRGIGKSSVELVARRGANIILACRDVSSAHKMSEMMQNVDAEHNCPAGKCTVAKLDLMSFNSILKCVEEIPSEVVRKIDVIICNAGIMAPKKLVYSEDGFESQLQVNHLGHMLLCDRLLRRKRKLGCSRIEKIIFVTSCAHFGALGICLDDLNCEKHYHPKMQYCRTKLCNILMAKEFTKRMQQDSVYPNGKAMSVHPGVVYTDLARDFCRKEFPRMLQPVMSPILNCLFPLCLRKQERAASLLISAVVSYDDEAIYVSRGLIRGPSRISQRADVSSRLWKWSINAHELLHCIGQEN
eukprot:jgi/Picsp_1/1081/NSC_04564-R1_retinol dehydrogenase 11-like